MEALLIIVHFFFEFVPYIKNKYEKDTYTQPLPPPLPKPVGSYWQVGLELRVTCRKFTAVQMERSRWI